MWTEFLHVNLELMKRITARAGLVKLFFDEIHKHALRLLFRVQREHGDRRGQRELHVVSPT